MTLSNDKQKKLHYDLANVGLRAQATAVGLLQLCIELRRVQVIDETAVERIKTAIAEEISMSTPRSMSPKDHRRDIKARLDRLFAGEQEVGSAEALSFGAPQP